MRFRVFSGCSPAGSEERSVALLRKCLFVILLAALLSCCCAALADTEYSLSPLPLNVTLRDDRTVVTPDTLGQHPELLTVIGMSRDDTIAEWQSRGVVLQAWSPIKAKYSCLEITVAQGDEAAQYADLMTHPEEKAAWKEYVNSFKKNDTWIARGYTFQSFEQRHAGSNYYVLLKYKRSAASGDYRGYMARTVYQGYTLVFDLKVYNQLPVDQNMNELNRVIKTVVSAPAAAVQATAAVSSVSQEEAPSGEAADGAPASAPAPGVQVDITQGPPAETNTNTFTVEGVTKPGTHIIGVLMRIGSSDSLKFETDANEKTGAFKLKVTIPEKEENIWLMTLNVLEGDKLVADLVFNNTTYKKTLIPVTLDQEVPEKIYSDELVIAGTTMKAVDVQCIVTDSAGNTVADKKSHPNGTGRFTFKLALKEEDEYSIALVITKKGYETKRFLYTVSRFLTEEARQALIRKQAVRVGYSALNSRIDQYIGKTMTFTVWITEMEEIGDEWRITAAGAKTNDHYSQLMVFIAEQEPAFAVEEKHTLFGICRQPYQIQSEETVEMIPSFDLLFWD